VPPLGRSSSPPPEACGRDSGFLCVHLYARGQATFSILFPLGDELITFRPFSDPFIEVFQPSEDFSTRFEASFRFFFTYFFAPPTRAVFLVVVVRISFPLFQSSPPSLSLLGRTFCSRVFGWLYSYSSTVSKPNKTIGQSSFALFFVSRSSLPQILLLCFPFFPAGPFFSCRFSSESNLRSPSLRDLSR